jgi:hypothetical protein
VSVQLLAIGDGVLTYSLQAGSYLPNGLTLSSTGLISGTSTGDGTSSFTVVVDDAQNQTTQQAITLVVNTADPYFKNTTLLVQADNIANTATNSGVVDSSANYNLVTSAGTPIQGTINPFGVGTWSNYLNGASYLTVPNNAALQLGSGDFTIEFWINYSSIAGYQTPYTKGYTSAGDILLQTGNGNGAIVVYLSGSAVITESTGATAGQWYHYALVRSGTTVTLYRDGVSRGTATSSVNFSTTDQLGIGAMGKAASGQPVGSYPVI